MNLLLAPLFIFCVTLCTPYDDAQTALLQLLDSSQHQCLVAVYTINNPVLINELVTLHARGVDTEVITDSTQAAGKHEAEAINYLRSNQIPVFIGKSKYHQIMHLKVCIIDQEKIATGSYNWTESANRQDNTLTIEDNSALAQQMTIYWNQVKTDMGF